MTDLVERLRMIRGTQFTPIENALVEEAASTIEALSERIAMQRNALVKCRNQFLEYERYHRNAARLVKAARNREMADMCDASLTPNLNPISGE